MFVSIYGNNRLILVGGIMTGHRSVIKSLSSSDKFFECNTIDDVKKIAGNEWYRCLKVGCIRNPYDLAVSLHFWYQQTIDPKSMTLATSVRNADWKNIFINALDSMLLDYQDYIMYESIHHDVGRIRQLFAFNQSGVIKIEEPTRPQDTEEDYRTLYDRRTRAIVTRLSRGVLDEFGYSF